MHLILVLNTHLGVTCVHLSSSFRFLKPLSKKILQVNKFENYSLDFECDGVLFIYGIGIKILEKRHHTKPGTEPKQIILRCLRIMPGLVVGNKILQKKLYPCATEPA